MLSSKICILKANPPPRYRRLPENRRMISVRCCASSRQISLGTRGHLAATPDMPKILTTVKDIVLEEGRTVHCEVEVISWRERKIKGQVTVFADVLSVWSILTDYERLADYVPNLVCSGIIPCPHSGRLWLEQVGFQRSMYWHIEARVVLDLEEFANSTSNRELRFSMVDGDFKKFDGKWTVTSGSSPGTTTLSYEVNVVPKFNFPAIFLERIITSDLPVNLHALASAAERGFSVSMLNKPSSSEFKETLSNAKFVPLSSSSKESHNNWGIFGKVCSLQRPSSMVDEVHLRRSDGLLESGGVHCVVASLTVKAPVREVWNVLTAYESLPEIVPNLAISTILSRKGNEVRILQEGCKGLLYMVLHAKVILDLHESHEQTITFEQVEGDFDYFRGKWSLEQLGSSHTLLRYSVESKMHRDSILSEAIMEEVIYEDLPSNLCAIRDHVERRESAGSHSSCVDSPEKYDSKSKEAKAQTTLKQRKRVPGLQNELGVLKSELGKFISEHGREGFMPMRKHLRLHGRIDIEKAITRMGGFRRIATLMNLSLAYKLRKPKGYWDNFENLQEEINSFQKEWGTDPSLMPSRKAFERAGRYDIARALEKWGGLQEVSRLLALKVRHPNRLNGKIKEPLYNEEKWVGDIKDLDINWLN